MEIFALFLLLLHIVFLLFSMIKLKTVQIEYVLVIIFMVLFLLG